MHVRKKECACFCRKCFKVFIFFGFHFGFLDYQIKFHPIFIFGITDHLNCIPHHILSISYFFSLLQVDFHIYFSFQVTFTFHFYFIFHFTSCISLAIASHFFLSVCTPHTESQSVFFITYSVSLPVSCLGHYSCQAGNTDLLPTTVEGKTAADFLTN